MAKAKKKKGPIRFEAIIPCLIVGALIYLYFFLFFDSNLRSAGQYIGTQVHGAEVNIAKVETSFWKAYFRLYGLQVTNKKEPTHNLIEIGRINFDLHWDALLRAKFVINEANIEDIKIASLRARPGRVLPPEAPSRSNLKKVEDSVLNQAKSDFDQNVLGDVANVLGGTSQGEQLAKINETLGAEKKIQELQKELKNKEKEWSERLSKLPNQKELNDLTNRAKKLKFNSNNPQQFAKSLQELQKILKEADDKIKLVNKTNSDLNKDIKKYQAEINSIDKWIEQDIKDLQKRMKIPQVDVGNFTMSLFGNMFKGKIAEGRKYFALVEEYMPPKKTAEQKAQAKSERVMPRERGSGRNIRFPITKGYPLFWLQKARITSKSSNSEFSGDLDGVITNVTSHPSALPDPAIIHVAGDFPKLGINGINIKATLDHRTSTPEDTVVGQIKSFPMKKTVLSQSDDVYFSIDGANGQSNFKAVLKNKKLNVSAKNRFTNVKYDVRSKNADLQDILKKTVDNIPYLTLDSTARGGWNDIAWGFDSNLGRELSKGIQRQIKAKIDAKIQAVRDQVNQKIKAQKDQLTAQYKKVTGEVNKKANDAKKKVEATKKKAQKDMNNKKKKAENSQKKKLEKEGKKLLKGLGL